MLMLSSTRILLASFLVLYSCPVWVNCITIYNDCIGKGTGQLLYPKSGIILSPGYGDISYDPNTNCIWTIEGYPEEMIELEVLHLDIEPGSICPGVCNHDILEVWEYVQGGANPAERVASLCGDIPGMRTYKTYSRSLRIKFSSDANNITGSGFALRFNIIIMNTTVEEFMFYHDNGTLLSPGYSTLKFPEGIEWYWYITAPIGHRIEMVVQDLNVSIPDASGVCADEFIRIRDGFGEDPGIVRFCGYHNNKQASLQTTGNKGSIHFRIVKNFRGYFWISWMFVKTVFNCGGSERGSLGTLISPRGQVFPDTYPHYARCTWNITVPAGKKVQLTTSDFYMEESDGCMYDRLEVRDGLDQENATMIGVYCGDRFTSARASAEEMSVVFISDSVINNGGFTIYWTAEEDLFTCDFETENACGMTQSSADHFDWQLNDGSGPGHPGPRAAEGGSGNHYYIEATDVKTIDDEIAEILTAPLGVTGSVCVQFTHHMFGKGVGELTVFTKDGVRSADVWTFRGEKGNKWHAASANATLPSANAMIGWRASRTATFRGDISIDSIVIYSGECTTPTMV